MAHDPLANDPYRLNATQRADLADEESRRQARFDNELQTDPELADDRTSGSKVAMFALAIAVVLGAAFYGLNNSSINQAGTSTAQNTAQTSPPAAPSGMRDVTPRYNTEPGTTTGAAPSRPQTPPVAAPPAVNNSATPPADNAPASK